MAYCQAMFWLIGMVHSLLSCTAAYCHDLQLEGFTATGRLHSLLELCVDYYWWAALSTGLHGGLLLVF